MNCPLFYMMNYTQAGELGYEVGDCLKGECAWWDSELEACSIVSLELELGSLLQILTAIGDKMPHEEQFRR